LQAARFVGREEELGQLLGALVNAGKEGIGSTWLVAGESGVGKSRLMDEIRIRALVRGAAVLRGQAVSDGGSPYEVWRRGLRRLTLSTSLSDAQAGVLKPLINDIDRLMEKEIAEAPELDSQAAQQRLITTVGELVTQLARQQQNPVVIMLEDLQWTGGESLDMLKALNQLAQESPLLIIGSYRDDERPDLPDQLPEMNLVPLARLNSAAIAELSESMLGSAGRQRAILSSW
jgi:predicted ATPase